MPCFWCSPTLSSPARQCFSVFAFWNPWQNRQFEECQLISSKIYYLFHRPSDFPREVRSFRVGEGEKVWPIRVELITNTFSTVRNNLNPRLCAQSLGHICLIFYVSIIFTYHVKRYSHRSVEDKCKRIVCCTVVYVYLTILLVDFKSVLYVCKPATANLVSQIA